AILKMAKAKTHYFRFRDLFEDGDDPKLSERYRMLTRRYAMDILFSDSPVIQHTAEKDIRGIFGPEARIVFQKNKKRRTAYLILDGVDIRYYVSSFGPNPRYEQREPTRKELRK
ncbi:MAG: hypothetical protein JW754_00400, partial [Candidatus Aenigmarchaeota archaeon]|nr:hypothetical protein [Candidatus Aenigmarchaeota archaeon]